MQFYGKKIDRWWGNGGRKKIKEFITWMSNKNKKTNFGIFVSYLSENENAGCYFIQTSLLNRKEEFNLNKFHPQFLWRLPFWRYLKTSTKKNFLTTYFRVHIKLTLEKFKDREWLILRSRNEDGFYIEFYFEQLNIGTLFKILSWVTWRYARILSIVVVRWSF